jgi:hypothetical protein
MFSTSAISRLACGVASLTSAGMVGKPARRTARQRRSPAISTKSPPSDWLTSTGCSTPCSRMDWASSSNSV